MNIMELLSRRALASWSSSVNLTFESPSYELHAIPFNKTRDISKYLELLRPLITQQITTKLSMQHGIEKVKHRSYLELTTKFCWRDLASFYFEDSCPFYRTQYTWFIIIPSHFYPVDTAQQACTITVDDHISNNVNLQAWPCVPSQLYHVLWFNP